MATNNTVPPSPSRGALRARLLLGLTAFLFSAWIGWLAYLAFTTTRPITLSRPQFLTAHVDVIATVAAKDDRPDPQVKVATVLWSRDPQVRPQAGQPLVVGNLSQVTQNDGWDGPGDYILALSMDGAGYTLAPIGVSPGFSSGSAPPRIYRVTRDTRAQHKLIRGAK